MNNIVDYINTNGKPNGQNGNTWNNIAKQFGFISGEAARRAYSRQVNRQTQSYENKMVDKMLFEMSGMAAIGATANSMSNFVQSDTQDHNNLRRQTTTTSNSELQHEWVHANGVKSPVYDWRVVADKDRTFRAIEEKETVLVIPDLHIPAELDKALEFCIKIRDKYKATKIIFIGDIVDNYCISLHLKDPNFPYTAGQEIEVSKHLLKAWHNAFPYATVIGGNHDFSRVFKTAKVAMIPKEWIRDIKEVLDTPTWAYTNELTHNGVYYTHGELGEAKKVAVYKGISTVQGHRHGQTYIDYPKKDLFAVQVGTLVDRTKMNFDYAKTYLHDWWNGVCVIQDGIPMLIPYNE